MNTVTSERPLRVAFLTRYEEQGASSRVRALQYLPLLEAAGIETAVLPLLSNAYVQQLYQGRRAWSEVLKAYGRRLSQCLRLGSYDLVWLEKELMPMVPYCVEALLLGRHKLVLDLDDAIFHSYDRASSRWVRRLLGDKIDRLMQRATLVTPGNSYLAARARASGARWIEALPSTVPLSRYGAATVKSAARASSDSLKIAWIGSPATAHYLELVRTALLHCAARRPISLHVIGAPAPHWHGLHAESIAWSEATEAAALAACDVGIMPLADTPWEQGKCSFKLIQYMACGLPVLASPVGMNRDVVHHGRNGWLARSDEDWIQALELVFDHPEIGFALGRQGRLDVESRYSSEIVGARLATLLKQASGTEPSATMIG